MLERDEAVCVGDLQPLLDPVEKIPFAALGADLEGARVGLEAGR
jgi:hypothetical protein